MVSIGTCYDRVFRCLTLGIHKVLTNLLPAEGKQVPDLPGSP